MTSSFNSALYNLLKYHPRVYHHLTGPCAAVTALRGGILLLDNVIDSVLATVYLATKPPTITYRIT